MIYDDNDMRIPRPLRFCTLSGFVWDTSGEAVENCLVRIRILEGVGTVVGRAAISASPETIYTENDGSFEFTLPRGALARIEIPESGIDAAFHVPNLAVATLENLRLQDYDPT